MSIEFTNLPLVDVSIRLVPLSDLPISLGAIKALILDSSTGFTELSDIEAFENPPGGGSIKPKLGGLNGFVLTNPQIGLTIDVHPTLLLFRWRRETASKPKPYPRFETLVHQLREVIILLMKVLELPSFSPKVVNMSYTNFVEASNGLTIGSSFPIINFKATQSSIIAEESNLTDFTVGWSEPNNGIDLRVRIDQAELLETQESPLKSGYILTTIAGKRLAEGEEYEQNVLSCHDRLIELFEVLLNEDAKQLFGYKP